MFPIITNTSVCAKWQRFGKWKFSTVHQTTTSPYGLNLISELVTAITVEVNADNFVTNPKQELSWKLGQHIETKNHLFFFFLSVVTHMLLNAF